MPVQPSQLQHFYRSHRETHDALQTAAWLCGLVKDDSVGVNQQPLSINEIVKNAISGKSYAWAFEQIFMGKTLLCADCSEPVSDSTKKLALSQCQQLQISFSECPVVCHICKAHIALRGNV